MTGHLALMLYTASSLLLIWKWKNSSSEITRMDPEEGDEALSGESSSPSIHAALGRVVLT